MSSTSNITISLQSTASRKGSHDKKSAENNGLDNEMNDDGFDKRWQSTRIRSPETGKNLPQGGHREWRDNRQKLK